MERWILPKDKQKKNNRKTNKQSYELTDTRTFIRSMIYELRDQKLDGWRSVGKLGTRNTGIKEIVRS